MIIEGLLSINELENPMVIKEKLIPFVAFQAKGGKVPAAKEEDKSESAA